jgi:hypothetical protein
MRRWQDLLHLLRLSPGRGRELKRQGSSRIGQMMEKVKSNSYASLEERISLSAASGLQVNIAVSPRGGLDKTTQSRSIGGRTHSSIGSINFIGRHKPSIPMKTQSSGRNRRSSDDDRNRRSIHLIEPDRPWFRAPPEFFVTLSFLASRAVARVVSFVLSLSLVCMRILCPFRVLCIV